MVNRGVVEELEKSITPLRSFARPLAHGVVHDVCGAEVEVAARIEVHRLLLDSARLAIHVIVNLEGVPCKLRQGNGHFDNIKGQSIQGGEAAVAVNVGHPNEHEAPFRSRCNRHG